MRVGLFGYATGPSRADTLALWDAHPFTNLMLAPNKKGRRAAAGVPVAEAARAAGRVVYLMSGCHKIMHPFLAAVDAVVAVHRTTPDQLLYYAWGVQRKPAFLVAHAADHLEPNKYWFRYASGGVFARSPAADSAAARAGVRAHAADPLSADFWEIVTRAAA